MTEPDLLRQDPGLRQKYRIERADGESVVGQELMPYVITTIERCPGLMVCKHLDSDHCSRRAVATLEETRLQVRTICVDSALAHGTTRDYPPAHLPSWAEDVITESGGSVGPLPDGTIIEVAPAELAELAAAVPRVLRDGESVIAAFNAAQERTREAPATQVDRLPVIERLIGHADWCPRKGEPANIGKHCSTCGERIRVNPDWESVEDRLRRQLAGAVDAERELLGMIQQAAQGDWDRTIPTLDQYAEARLRELGGQ